MHEKLLIDSLKKQDKKAWENSINEYKELVFKVICKKIKCTEDAEELMQEVFVKAFLKINQFEGRAKFSTWLVGIAINTTRTFLKSVYHQRHLLNETIETNEVKFLVSDVDPEQVLVQKEKRNLLIQLLSQLSDKQRTACTLYFFEDLQQTEIADIMGTSLDAVESLIHRGKEKMKALIQIPQNSLL